MMAAWLRWCLAVEAVTLAVAAWALMRLGGWHPVAAVATAAGIVLALHSAPLAAGFVISRRHSSPPPPSLATDLRLAWREWLVYLAFYIAIQPFERLWMAADAVAFRPTDPAEKRVPVLLIHGYMCNRGLWWWLRRRLRAAGIDIATVNLEPPLAGIETFAARLHERIEALATETGAERVALVGHSMGGLVARAYVARHGADRVAQLVTLASPHHGSVVARYGPGKNAREMEPDSDFIDKLPPADPRVPSLSIWSPADNFVAPQDSARLAGAAEIVLPSLTHLALLFSPLVLETLRRELVRSIPPADPSVRHGDGSDRRSRQK
jgi:triacylglycerol lipase